MRVLFVSKPIVAPFFDGTKCLVRDVATHLERHDAVVMGTGGAPDPALISRRGGSVEVAPVYLDAGAYAPALTANARAAAWLVTRSRADVWHFVFAPNPATSTVGRVARALRRVPVVQTVASPPRSYAPDVFFGDVVVAQSEDTRRKIQDAFSGAGKDAPEMAVIPPPLAPLRARTERELHDVRRSLALPEGAVVFTYPGDLEVSDGAETVADAVPLLLGRFPDAFVVFACRPKTKEAPLIEARLAARLPKERVRFARELDLPALLAITTVVLFPVDDLTGKVDIPIALLEAMSLGVPVVVPETGPLADLRSVARAGGRDPRALATVATELVLNDRARGELVARARDELRTRHSAGVVASAYERLYESVSRDRARTKPVVSL